MSLELHNSMDERKMAKSGAQSSNLVHWNCRRNSLAQVCPPPPPKIALWPKKGGREEGYDISPWNSWMTDKTPGKHHWLSLSPFFDFLAFWKFLQSYLQSKITAKLIPRTFFYVAEMRFSKKIIPKQFFHVIPWITNEYM